MSKRPRESRLQSGQRTVPDYTNRGTKLRLFLFLAALMLALAVAERARDPKFRQWLWQIDKLAENRDLLDSRLPDQPPRHDPPGTLMMADALSSSPAAPEIDPVDRAWQ